MKTILPLTSIIVALQIAVSTAPAQTYTFTIFAGQTNAIGTTDGSGTAALFNHPRGLAADSSGNVYVADTYNSSIRKITPDGNVSTMTFKILSPVLALVVTWPPWPPVYEPFGFSAPQSILADSGGNLYISDDNIIYNTSHDTATNNPDPGTLVVTAFAGNQSETYTPTETVGLIFNHPRGMGLDSSNNLYVADEYNQVIREITPSGGMSILAGMLGVPVSQNGAGTNAGFTMPYGIAVGRSNTVYVTDSEYYLRQIIQTNLVTNFWSPDSYTTPYAIATDAAGDVYVVAGVYKTNYVLKLLPGGGSNVLGVLPTTGLISAIAVDADRNIYLADQQNSVIIKGTPSYPAFFNGQAALGGGVEYLAFTGGTPFGYYNLGSFDFPVFYHDDMGFEYFYDANDGHGGAYLYDYASSTTWYTSPKVFPYLYDFSLNAWLYYYPDVNRPGHYTSNPRSFYNFGTGQIITK